ncbi:secreted phosphoprotein 24 isoform X1 [Choloepus didactylus]|uniref:secreted phosphoprotein 24 isoform X1 n=1 Tax=Choloepus didactylus TaxID=27675 RepID=UPI00189FE214|nr:secreted phosphoprotein 24 isoform X1 [Choloepus didactylus]
MTKILIMLVLAMNCWPCSGFPVYDYDPSSVREALGASVAKVNAQSLSPYLFRAFRSSVRRINVLDDDTLSMDLEFSIRETTCRRDSEQDPSTCDFQRGYFVPTAVCRSTVQVSADQVQDVWVRCGWPSSSESSSSEEMIFGDILGSYKWRNNDQLAALQPGPVWTKLFVGIKAPSSVWFRNGYLRLFRPGISQEEFAGGSWTCFFCPHPPNVSMVDKKEQEQLPMVLKKEGKRCVSRRPDRQLQDEGKITDRTPERRPLCKR